VVAEDVGGGPGRNVFFRVASGDVEVKSMVRGDVVI
jgi:chemotaxis receptor (MCP) glutamine deamidase CheD